MCYIQLNPKFFLGISLFVFLLGILPAAADEAEDWFHRGNQFQQENHSKEAIQAYQRSISLNPNYWVTYQNLGLVYKKTKQYKKAEESFQNALKLAPGNLDIHLNLGNVYNFLEDWGKAIAHLNRVVHNRRKDPVAHGNLGWAYYNYQSGPPFKLLVIMNLQRAIELFNEKNMRGAAKATQKTLEEALKKFGMENEKKPL